ncbi:MAG: acyltransferase [Actinomycetota bacterium]|nr:acyltransferase [Actinomycetota bacterium]
MNRPQPHLPAALDHFKGRLLDRLAASIARRSVGIMAQELLNQHTVFGHADRVHVASTAVVNNVVFNTVSGEITVENWVMIAHGVHLVTGEHDITKFGVERQLAAPYYERDIVIEEGAWLATNVIVLGPCRVGKHAVVAAGSLVRTDVPAYSVFAGVPARQVASVPHPATGR